MKDEKKVALPGLALRELVDFMASLEEKPFRARQLYHHFYQRACFDPNEMTDMSRSFRSHLLEAADFALPRVACRQVSRDGSSKYLFTLADGLSVEAVHIPDEDRTTLCLSTQVGCAMGCRFCATAGLGFSRNLTAGEILGQFFGILLDLGQAQAQPNVVFMGMGEPLMNLEEVMKAFSILNDPEGVAIARRRITLSTCGLVEGVRKLAEYPVRPRLAVSLNATTEAARSDLMPVNRKNPLSALLTACRQYPLAAGDRITFEYMLISGVNDSPADARRLVRLLGPIPSKVNLIIYNKIEGKEFAPPSEAAAASFQKILNDNQVSAFVRKSRGGDIGGACGQLAGRNASR